MGNQWRAIRDADLPVIPLGFCQCGCGLATAIPTKTSRKVGRIKGIPARFLPHHHLKMQGGKNSPRWNGGTKTQGGYKFLLIPEHPRADAEGYIQEHIVVAEKALGRSLPNGVVVHHANQKQCDNKNSNLVICESIAYHTLLHQRIRAVNAGFPAHWLKCKSCKTYDDPSRMWIGKYPKGGQRHRGCEYKERTGGTR
jgi:hypothetical protein